MAPRMLPAQQIQEVDSAIDKLISDAAKYDNRELLDDSQCWSLHLLASEIYAAGYEDGERAEAARNRGQRFRDREATSIEPKHHFVDSSDLSQFKCACGFTVASASTSTEHLASAAGRIQLHILDDAKAV